MARSLKVIASYFFSLKKSSAELKKILANGQVGARNWVLATCTSRYSLILQWLAYHKQGERCLLLI